MKGLTPGRIVHYITGTGKHLPAMVVHIWNQSGEDEPDYATVNLAVFNPMDGDHGEEPPVWNKTSITYQDAEHNESGTWHWIEPA